MAKKLKEIDGFNMIRLMSPDGEIYKILVDTISEIKCDYTECTVTIKFGAFYWKKYESMKIKFETAARVRQFEKEYKRLKWGF